MGVNRSPEQSAVYLGYGLNANAHAWTGEPHACGGIAHTGLAHQPTRRMAEARPHLWAACPDNSPERQEACVRLHRRVFFLLAPSRFGIWRLGESG